MNKMFEGHEFIKLDSLNIIKQESKYEQNV